MPAERTSFVGRDRELADLERLLARFRLVTVTGVGGVGKTRLALRAAAGHDAWFVDLSSVRDLRRAPDPAADAELVARAVADTLGVREVSARPPLALLTGYLARRRLLLVLDSCEPVRSGCATMVQALLADCPALRILATSRDVLDVPGETRFVVGPLPVPPPGNSRDPAAYASVALFVARTRAVRPGFRLGEANHDAVAGICHRLDGIPLAIELAAARLRTLSPRQVLDQLTDRLDAPGESPGAADRHRTLRACVDWSFDLCTVPERLLWTRLSVFADGFDLDAVEGVCADGTLPRLDVLDHVTGLVDKSVLVVEHQGDRARYRMLDTLRDYGRARLAGAGTRLRRRHRDWYERLVARARDDFVSPRQPYWLAQLGREHANLRAAVEFSLDEPGGAEVALRIAVTMPWPYWVTRGLFGEARRWLDAGLARVTPATGEHARALLLAGCLAALQGEFDTAARLLDQGEKLALASNDPVGLVLAPYGRGLAVGMRNDLEAAIGLLEVALDRLAALPRPDLELRLRIMITLGVDAALIGRRREAEARYLEIVRIAETRGGSYYRAVALWSLGTEAFRRGSVAVAADQVAASLRIRQESLRMDRYGITLCLESMAWIAARVGQHHRAATLLGAADALWDRMGTSIGAHGNLNGSHDDCVRQARDHLGEQAYEAGFARGRELSCAEAVGYALDGPGRPALSPGPPGPSTPAASG